MHKPPPSIASLALFGSGIVMMGCTGTLGFFSGEGDEGEANNSPGDSAAPDAECTAGATELEGRLLTSRQYEHTILDLFGIGAALAADEPRAGSAVSYSLARVDEVGAEEFASRADELAQELAADLATHFPCSPEVGANDPCVGAWLSNLGLSVYRRPLTADETTQLSALFGAGYAEGGASTGVDWLLSGMLQAPDFLYRLVLTRPDQDGQTGPLGPHELATRLSYFLWDSLPDSELFAIANEGQLTEEEILISQVERMMSDPKFERALRVFYNHWLGMGAFAEVSRDVWSESGVDVGEQIIASLRGSVAETVSALYKQEHPNLREFFSSTEYFVDPTLADFYGISATFPEGTSPDPCVSPDAPDAPGPADDTPAVNLYGNCNFDESGASFHVALPVGTYSSADLSVLGVAPDAASSIRVTSGYDAILYPEDDFMGTSLTLDAEVSCMTSVNFNDTLASIEVRAAAPETTSPPDATPCPNVTAGHFVKVDLGQEGRRGILTHPALMTAMARPDATFPIARGLFVVEQLLCQHLEVPEAIDIPPLGPVPAGGTERDQLEMHNADPVCASCHSIIDPPGFSFQSFDEVGRLRPIPEGDDTGVMTGSGDLDGAFANGTELFERIAESQTVRACFAQHFFEFALSRPAEIKGQEGQDQCSLESIQNTFRESGDLKELIAQVVLSQPFRTRLYSLAKDGQ